MPGTSQGARMGLNQQREVPDVEGTVGNDWRGVNPGGPPLHDSCDNNTQGRIGESHAVGSDTIEPGEPATREVGHGQVCGVGIVVNGLAGRQCRIRVGTGVAVRVRVMVPTRAVVVVPMMVVTPAVAVRVLGRRPHMNVRPGVVTGNLPTTRVDEGY